MIVSCSPIAYLNPRNPINLTPLPCVGPFSQQLLSLAPVRCHPNIDYLINGTTITAVFAKITSICKLCEKIYSNSTRRSHSLTLSDST